MLYQPEGYLAEERQYEALPDPDLPAGYVLALGRRSSRKQCLAVPVSVMDAILNDQARADQAEVARLQGVTSDDSWAAKQQQKAGFAGSNNKSQSKNSHAVDLSLFDKTWRKPTKRLSVRVWDPAKVRRQVQEHNELIGNADTQSRQRDAAVFRSLGVQGPWKPVVRPENVEMAIDQLSQEFVHMPQAVELVANQLSLGVKTKAPLRIPPLLLVGLPGVGKTYFALRLGQIINTPMHRVDFSSQQTNSHLTGTDRHWANSRYGVLFENVVMGGCANPLLVLEELDKARSSGSASYDPLAPLHTALEPSTARAMKDLSNDIEFDASYVNYVATANTLKGLPDSLLSRMHLIHCQAPDPSLAYNITRSVVTRVMSTEAGKHFEPVPRDVIRELAVYTPREVTKLLERAMGRASRAGRKCLKVEDFGAPSNVARH